MKKGWEHLPSFSRALYIDTYFLPGEDYNNWLTRVSTAYQNDEAHGKRMREYIKNLWFHPSTPPSMVAGTDRGLPISCFTGSVEDSKEGIFQSYDESNWLGAMGGGIGWDWSKVRSINEPVGKHNGKSSGVIPFLGVSDRATLAISQGGARRASQAKYLHISHPEIEEFIDIRKETGDRNRRCVNLHHGVVIPDIFIKSVIHNLEWEMKSPKTGEVLKSVSARKLWAQILEARIQTGEPYLLFIDTVNNLRPKEYSEEDIVITTSNLCSEITLRTDDKHMGVCCLGSINLEHWDEYHKQLDGFIADCTDYLDNILQDFIDKTEGVKGFERARNGAIDERSIGLGVMGFHSLLQSKMIPWESAMAQGLNMKIFKAISNSAEKHNIAIGKTSPIGIRTGTGRRNTHITAIAPTMSISSLCGVTSSGIEPIISNIYTKKVKTGSYALTNKYLLNFLETMKESHGQEWLDEQIASIKEHKGSVQHLDWMPSEVKDVFKTAYELDQRWLIEFAGDRSPFIDQAQSLNLFIPAGSNVQYISDLHLLAWKKGIKSLYYVRSSAGTSASTVSDKRKQIIEPEECLSCQ